MSQRLALFIGTALVGGLGYFALSKNDTEYDTDDSDEDNDKKDSRGGSTSWWDNFTSVDDIQTIEEDSVIKPTRRRVGGGGGSKSKKHRPSAVKKTRASRKY
jgi:hypothetical protein